VASKPVTVTGVKATMKTQVRYVDDQTPNSYRTYANYKEIVVTITRDRDSKELARETTYVSAATRASAADTIIRATVLDLKAVTPVAGTTVNLSTGPSAPRSDVTDASGEAVFPALTANPASGPQAYYDLSLSLPSGYVALREDVSPNPAAHKQLGITEKWEPVLRVYKPSTINVSIPTPNVPYTVSVGSERGAQHFSQPASATVLGVSAIDAGLMNPEPLVPLPSPGFSYQYLVGASAVSGTNYWYSPAVTKPVPSSYPSSLTETFGLSSGTWYTAAQVKPLTVKVQTSGGSALNGAQVAVSGGPGSIYVSGVTSTSTIDSTLSSGTIANPSGGSYTSGAISAPGGASYASGTISTGTTYSSGTITSQTWSSGAWYTSVSGNCASQTAGNCNTTPAAGTITSATFSFGSAIGGSSQYSVQLYRSGSAQGSTCTINGGQTGCTISGLSVSVNGSSDTIVLVVTRTSGTGTSYTGTGSASAIRAGSWSSGNWYTSISSSCASQTAGSCNTTPTAGTISSASFSFGSAIGSSSSYSVTLYKNGASTGSSCAIGSNGTGCTISGLSLAVNGTDTVVLVVSRTSGSGTSYTGTGNASATMAGAWTNATWYTSVSGSCTSQTAGSCTTVPSAGTLTDAGFAFASAIAAGSSYLVTLYKNGASTGSTCTIAAGQTGCTISGLSIAMNGTSDTMVLVVTRTAGTSYTGTGTGSATVTGSWGSGSWYTSVSTACASQTAGSCNTTPAAGTITSASFSFGSAIGSSSSYTVTLYKNGASTGSSCTIGNSQASCAITGLNVAVNGTSDTVVLVVSRTAGSSYSGTGTAAVGHSTPPAAGQITFNVPSGSGYTVMAWGATTMAQTTATVTSPTTKTLTVS
jgi:hypothetical protein